MLRVIAQRVMLLPLVLIGVSIGLFLISRVVPSDPVRLIVGDSVSPELRAAMEEQMHLNDPMHLQFMRYVGDLANGNLGDSMRFNLPVMDLIVAAFPATLILVAASAVIAIVIAFPLGFAAAKWRDTWFDVVVRGFAMIGISTPAFVLGIVMILIFGLSLGWFPVSGRGDPPDLAHLLMPAFVLGLRDAGSSIRILRAGLLDAMGEDFVRSARARGISEGTIVLKLAGRNAMIPTMTDMGLRFASLAGQVILVESVFSWPGIGKLLEIGVRWNDFSLVAGCVMVMLVYVVLINLIVDILYRVVDPRLRDS